MAIEIKHKFQSAKSDGGDTSLVRPSNWNDTHEIEVAAFSLIGRASAGVGAAQEITLGAGLSFSGSTLAASLSLEGIHAAASKTTPVDADELPLVDSAASWGLKKLTWANLKAAIASIFMTISGASQTITGLKRFSSSLTGINQATGAGTMLEAFAGGTQAAAIAFHRNGVHASYFGVDTDNRLKWGGWSFGANAYEVWHHGRVNAAGWAVPTAPTENGHVATKQYVDASVGSAVRQTFGASGTWTKPAGVSPTAVVLVEVWGAGGGGTSVAGGPGGGGGAYAREWFTMSQLAASVAVTIGAGGAVSGAGGTGGASSFGSYLSAVGGGGGGGASGGAGGIALAGNTSVNETYGGGGGASGTVDAAKGFYGGGGGGAGATHTSGATSVHGGAGGNNGAVGSARGGGGGRAAAGGRGEVVVTVFK